MPVFEYKGFDSAGKAVKGSREGEGEKTVRTLLKRDGILATEIRQSGKSRRQSDSALSKDVNFSFLQSVSTQDVAMMTRQLGTLLQAGVPMVESFTALIEQTETPMLRRVLSQIKQEVNEGDALADAMTKHPRVFDPVFINMVRAAEQSGTLDVVLERLADLKENQAKIRGEIMSAMMYPMIMVVVGFLNVGVLFTVVVPRITRIFEHAKATLPLQTRMLMAFSGAVRSYWWLMIALSVLAVWLFLRWKKSPTGRDKWDTWMLKLPVFGPIIRLIAVARFSRTLGTLLSSGVSLLVSLDIVRNVVNNTVLARAVDTIRDAVREGEDIAKPLKRTGQFPPLVSHMVAVGEKSGQLEQMLGRVATSYETQADQKMKGLMSLLSPLLILVMGLAVGFIVFAIMTPIMQMNQFVK